MCAKVDQLLILEMVIPPFTGNPYNGNINPYYWFDDHPLFYGKQRGFGPQHRCCLLKTTCPSLRFHRSRPKARYPAFGVWGNGLEMGAKYYQNLGESLQKLLPEMSIYDLVIWITPPEPSVGNKNGLWISSSDGCVTHLKTACQKLRLQFKDLKLSWFGVSVSFWRSECHQAAIWKDHPISIGINVW